MSISLEKIFKDDVKEPFFYNFNLNNNNVTITELFTEIKNIYFLGFQIHYGTKEISFDKNYKTKIDKINNYMLSLGIEVDFQEYDDCKIDFTIRKYLYDIEKIKDLSIIVNSDWHTSLIDRIEIKSNNLEIINKIKEIAYAKHKNIIHILSLFDPRNLRDHCIKLNFNKKIYIISFDYAKVINSNHKFYEI